MNLIIFLVLAFSLDLYSMSDPECRPRLSQVQQVGEENALIFLTKTRLDSLPLKEKISVLVRLLKGTKSERAGFFSTVPEVKASKNTFGSAPADFLILGGENNGGFFKFRRGSEPRAVKILVESAPRRDRITAKGDQKIVSFLEDLLGYFMMENARLSDRSGGPKVFNFGVVEVFGDRFFFVEMEDLAPDSVLKTLSSVKNETTIFRPMKDGVVPADEIADMLLDAYLQKYIPWEADFGLTSTGVRWFDPTNWSLSEGEDLVLGNLREMTRAAEYLMHKTPSNEGSRLYNMIYERARIRLSPEDPLLKLLALGYREATRIALDYYLSKENL